MLDIEVNYATNRSDRRRITKSRPVSFGRHASNDICIDEPDVAPIHCRVSWNPTQSEYEVAAANRDGVDLNGTLVRHALLKEGDVMRIGSADVIIHGAGQGEPPETLAFEPHVPLDDDDEFPEPTVDAQSREVPLKPISRDDTPNREGWARNVFKRSAGAAEIPKSRPEDSKKRRSAPAPIAERSIDVNHGSAQQGEEEDGESFAASGPETDYAIVLPPRGDRADPPRPAQAARLSDRSNRSRVRPGDQEALRSPVILGMFGALLALALTAAAIYFVIGRETAQKDFNDAVAEFDAKHYGQAIDLFDKFLHEHGRHALADEAQYKLWDARVLKEIGTASPAWKRGLDAVNDYVDANRERSDFHDHNPDLIAYLQQIAFGAVAAAESSKERDLLEVGSNAEITLTRYYPDGKAPPELISRFQAAYTSAQNAIVRHERFGAKVAEIEKANADRRPMEALAARRAILALYPDTAGDPRLATLLKQTLDVEKGLVVGEQLNKPAVNKETAPAVPTPVTLTPHSRSQTEESAGTRPVFVLAKDCCYGVDHVTGEPVWRRPIGLDSPFFPISVETSVPGLLIFDTNQLALILVERRTGKLIWQQTLNEPASGPPLVEQGQIYLATFGRHLYKIDLDSGRISTRLTFSQKILSPPALVHNRERLVVAGDASLVYTLSIAPLACSRVDVVGHAPGSLVNGPMEIGSLILLAESGQPSGSHLDVLDARNDDNWLKTLKVEPIEGMIRDTPIIYGRTLFVASLPARISAFSVSDTPGQESLTRTTSLSVPNQGDSPIFLSGGPDGQLWMAGSSLRRLQFKLNTQSVALDPSEIAVGTSSQKLQVVGQYLYAARRLPYAASIFFSQVDREPMVGRWRTIFGSSVIGRGVGPAGEALTVGESGEVFSIAPSSFESGGFHQAAAANIEPPPGTKTPLRATTLDDGRIAVDCGLPKPKLWFVSRQGQTSEPLSLEHPLEAAPVLLARTLVLPLPGRLRLTSPQSGVADGEDFVAPVAGPKTAHWTHLTRLGENDLFVADSQGRISRLQYRTEPRRYLAAVVDKTDDRPIDLPVAVAGSRIAYADADGVLHVRDAGTLDPVLTQKLQSPAVSGLWAVGSMVLFETQDHELVAYDVDGQPKLRFHIPLEKTGPAGRPALVRGRLVVPNRDGTVLALDPSTGAIAARVSVGEILSGGTIAADGHAIVTSIGGSLHRVDQVVESQKGEKGQ